MRSLSDDVNRRAGEPHCLGHHSNLLFMDPALYMLRLPTAPSTTLTICVCMRRKRRESCRRPLDPASACSRRQSGHAGVHTLARHRARHADGCERCGCVGSRLGAVRCALARSVCRGVVCGDLSAGLSGPAVAGGLVRPCWTILVALYARVRPFARVELPAERVSIRVDFPRLCVSVLGRIFYFGVETCCLVV